jgi:hypothetical protein
MSENMWKQVTKEQAEAAAMLGFETEIRFYAQLPRKVHIPRVNGSAAQDEPKTKRQVLRPHADMRLGIEGKQCRPGTQIEAAYIYLRDKVYQRDLSVKVPRNELADMVAKRLGIERYLAVAIVSDLKRKKLLLPCV